MTTTAAWTTTDELLAMPDDGVERDLIRGELRERGTIPRTLGHSRANARIAYLLLNWLDARPAPRGEVLSGGAAFRLRRNPDTTVGIDVAYVSAATPSATPTDDRFVEGPPILAVEILSLSDRQEDVLEKVQEYLDCGTKLVWVVEPVFRTIVVYRPDAQPQLFNETQTLSGEPHLPGFSVEVARIFKQ